MTPHSLAAKTNRKLKYIRFKTYRSIKTASHRLKTFFFDPNDIAPGDDFPIGPLMFLEPKSK